VATKSGLRAFLGLIGLAAFLAGCSDMFGPLTVPRLITTVAGNGKDGFSGDGGAAASATLSGPDAVAVDAAGNVYVADTGNNRIRKVSANGTITTVAGNGNPGFSGDNGPATSAQLANPNAIAVDAAGNIYFADGYNNRVRKVDAAGIISTYAGAGTSGFAGDNGPATSAFLGGNIGGLAVDSAGNLYLADSNNQRIRKVNPAGIITTIAGNGTTTYAGENVPALSTGLSWPQGVALDASGNMYSADGWAIHETDSSGTLKTFLNFSSNVLGLAVDGKGNVYGVTTVYTILKASEPLKSVTIGGNGKAGFSGDDGPATSAEIQPVSGNNTGNNRIAVDSSGTLYIADSGNNRIRKVYADSIYAP
jgi:sugar lactone lactonase YvrE